MLIQTFHLWWIALKCLYSDERTSVTVLIPLFAFSLTTHRCSLSPYSEDPTAAAVAASAESFDNCHSSSPIYGPGANSPSAPLAQSWSVLLYVVVFKGMNTRTIRYYITGPPLSSRKTAMFNLHEFKVAKRQPCRFKSRMAVFCTLRQRVPPSSGSHSGSAWQ